MGMNSCLYLCEVMHHRAKPARHRFDYRFFMFYLDLDELGQISDQFKLIGYQNWKPYRILASDHMGYRFGPLKERVLEFLAEQGVVLEGGLQDSKVFLLTHARTWGYIFNPVCFYFCFDKSGKQRCVIAEVTNTFREQKLYLLMRERELNSGVFYRRVLKNFYVSPFSELDVEFDFTVGRPRESFSIQVDDYQGGEKILTSSLTGKRRQLTDANLFLLIFRYPFVTFLITIWIHWNALKLWLKKIPYQKKSDQPEKQKDFFEEEGTYVRG